MFFHSSLSFLLDVLEMQFNASICVRSAAKALSFEWSINSRFELRWKRNKWTAWLPAQFKNLKAKFYLPVILIYYLNSIFHLLFRKFQIRYVFRIQCTIYDKYNMTESHFDVFQNEIGKRNSFRTVISMFQAYNLRNISYCT